MTVFFHGVTSLDEAQSRYRALAKQYHPDCGGDAETMARINAEYAQVKRALREKPVVVARAQPTSGGATSHHTHSESSTWNPDNDWANFATATGHDPIYYTEADFWANKCEGW